MVAVNVLYNVGSKDEFDTKTGFAHLFEHLMFGGSVNIKDFDTPLHNAGGENNAFTNGDITNFYDTVPIENLDTVLWLESDRMLALAFNKRSLNVQKKVVVEEFKETCLNQPYGDAWHHLSDMNYKQHPYRWPTIGLDPIHIEQAELEDVKSFFHKYYCPANAILVVAGPIQIEETLQKINAWFGEIAPGVKNIRHLPTEQEQENQPSRIQKSHVPAENLYITFKMPGRMHPDFYAIDLLSDILGDGSSSRFYDRLVKDQKLFSYIDAYITGSIEPGLFVIEGRPSENVSIEVAEQAIWTEIDKIQKELINEEELLKLKRKLETSNAFSETSILNKAINLAYYELLNEPDLINTEFDYYYAVSAVEIKKVANEILQKSRSNVLVYVPDETVAKLV
jgi:predicted Zn-dependent peptidase